MAGKKITTPIQVKDGKLIIGSGIDAFAISAEDGVLKIEDPTTRIAGNYPDLYPWGAPEGYPEEKPIFTKDSAFPPDSIPVDRYPKILRAFKNFVLTTLPGVDVGPGNPGDPDSSLDAFVEDGDLVVLADDGKWHPATCPVDTGVPLEDAIAMMLLFSGVYIASANHIVTSSLVAHPSWNFPQNTPLYLDCSNPGKMTTVKNQFKVGIAQTTDPVHGTTVFFAHDVHFIEKQFNDLKADLLALTIRVETNEEDIKALEQKLTEHEQTFEVHRQEFEAHKLEFEAHEQEFITYKGSTDSRLDALEAQSPGDGGGGGGDVPIATTQVAGKVKPDGATITVEGDGTIRGAKATSSQIGMIKPDGKTITVDGDGLAKVIAVDSGSGPEAPPGSVGIATTAKAGIVKPDGTTITVDKEGLIKAVGGGGGGTNVPIATTSVAGKVKPDGSSITVESDGTIKAKGLASGITLPGAKVAIATASTVGVVKPDGTTITVDSKGTLKVPVADRAVKGLVQPDNTTISISSGTLSAIAASTSRRGIVQLGDTPANDSTKALTLKGGQTLQTAIGTKLDKSAVLNVLTSTDSTKALSAAQGKVLNDKIVASASGVLQLKGSRKAIGTMTLTNIIPNKPLFLTFDLADAVNYGITSWVFSYYPKSGFREMSKWVTMRVSYTIDHTNGANAIVLIPIASSVTIEIAQLGVASRTDAGTMKSAVPTLYAYQ